MVKFSALYTSLREISTEQGSKNGSSHLQKFSVELHVICIYFILSERA